MVHKNTVTIIIYEKTYLFISLDPYCFLFNKFYESALKVKKLNFLNNMTNFDSIYLNDNYENFIKENNEIV